MSFSKFVKGSLVIGTVGAAATALGAYLCSLEEDVCDLPDEKPVFKIMPGDMVQWESGGALIFPQPKEVIRLEKSDMGTYVFVEGSSCGIPLSQVVPMS